ncbi:DUF4817 domain-containing protein [Trichonephila clavipes]|nr:DUF4817 domain-containing protein [Trichonephila clavipes]
MSSNPGQDMDACKCIVPARHGGTLNSRRATSLLVRLVKGEERGRLLTTPRVFSLLIAVESSQTVMSPVWCLKLRLTTGVTFPFAMMNFMALDLAFANQVGLVTTTTYSKQNEVQRFLVVLQSVKSGKGPLTPAGLLKLVKRFEETGKLEDRARAGRPCLKEARAPCIAVEMEAIAPEAASGTSSAREAARRLGLPPSSVRNIFRRILQLYPYKLQSCHELLPADTAQREAFAKWAFSKMEQDPTWVFNILWTDEAHFSLHGDVNNHNCRIWATSNPREYTQKPLHSPKVTAWCGFTGSFIIGPFFFETQCPVNGWITETVNAQRYLTLLRETVVPCLIQRGQISNVTFMQDGATSHTANSVKAFLIQTFGEDRIVSRHCRYPWPPRSPDLTPADFWLWGYLKSRVYLSGPSSLSELKDAIHREVSSIHPDMLHSAVAGFVTRLECLLPCGGGHVEHILV